MLQMLQQERLAIAHLSKDAFEGNEGCFAFVACVCPALCLCSHDLGWRTREFPIEVLKSEESAVIVRVPTMHDKRCPLPMVDTKCFLRHWREKGREGKGVEKSASHGLTNASHILLKLPIELQPTLPGWQVGPVAPDK